MILETERILFFDDAWVESVENMSFTLNAPTKCGPIAVTEKEWEIQPGGGVRAYCVVPWRGGYRFYYSVTLGDGGYCLALLESDDGVSWSRPDLGVVRYGGETANNLVDVGNHWIKGLTVFVDSEAPEEHRFKLLGHNPKEGMFLLTSPDGLTFSRQKECLLPFNADSMVSAFYDPAVDRYRVYLRAWDRTRPIYNVPGSRVVAITEVQSLFEPFPLRPDPPDPWPQRPPRRMFGDELASPMRRLNREIEPYVLWCDEADPDKADIYQSAALHYAPGVYLAFPTLYFHYPPPPNGFINDGVLDLHFASSRDGITWNRKYREPYVGLDLPDGWCTKALHMLNGAATDRYRIHQYVIGSRRTHGEGRTKLDPPPDTKPRTPGSPIAHRIEQRLDGFVSLDSAYTGGTLVTAPFEIGSETLRVNIDTSASGYAHAALLDESGAPIPGYEIEASRRIQANDVRCELHWNGRPDVSALRGRKVRLMMRSRATKLYAVYYRDAEN